MLIPKLVGILERLFAILHWIDALLLLKHGAF